MEANLLAGQVFLFLHAVLLSSIRQAVPVNVHLFLQGILFTTCLDRNNIIVTQNTKQKSGDASEALDKYIIIPSYNSIF